jgi:hypothetical protein
LIEDVCEGVAREIKIPTLSHNAREWWGTRFYLDF